MMNTWFWKIASSRTPVLSGCSLLLLLYDAAREAVHVHAHTIDIIDYVTGIGNIVTGSPIDSNTFHGGMTGTFRVAWLCGPLLEFV